ncbi:MAG: hypothetical protein ACTSRH_12780 [Promethearchaeota archaeon]
MRIKFRILLILIVLSFNITLISACALIKINNMSSPLSLSSFPGEDLLITVDGTIDESIDVHFY